MATSEEYEEQTQAVCLVSNYGYLNNTTVTETESWMQRHSSSPSLSVLLLLATECFHRECSYNIRVQHT